MNERLAYLIETLSTSAEPGAVELATLAKEEIDRLKFTVEQLDSVYTFLDIQKDRLAKAEQKIQDQIEATNKATEQLRLTKSQLVLAEAFIPEQVKPHYKRAWDEHE